jgi:hypothetical protein
MSFPLAFVAPSIEALPTPCGRPAFCGGIFCNIIIDKIIDDAPAL